MNINTAGVYIAHPYTGSFNHAVYHRVLETLESSGVKIFSHDLYQEGFNPVLTPGELGFDESKDPLVLQYAEELMMSDLLIFIHPNWWGQPPAILKGWIDRVIRPPYAYDYPPELPVGDPPVQKMKGKAGMVFNTSNTPDPRERDYFGDPLENIWKQCVFGFCGIRMVYRKMFRTVADSSPEIRESWLDEVRSAVEKVIR
jgi:putative NADPH-quinone reductase